MNTYHVFESARTEQAIAALGCRIAQHKKETVVLYKELDDVSDMTIEPEYLLSYEPYKLVAAFHAIGYLAYVWPRSLLIQAI